MNMISLTFFAFVAVLFSTLVLCRKIVTDDAKYIALYRYVLLFASYAFVLYADVRFALVLSVEEIKEALKKIKESGMI